MVHYAEGTCTHYIEGIDDTHCAENIRDTYYTKCIGDTHCA